MDPYQVIVKPLVTEQGMNQSKNLNTYPFQVHHQANKTQIKWAIQSIYNVKVHEVRTANRKGKPRRRGYSHGHTSGWKKAWVVLHEDSHIDLF